MSSLPVSLSTKEKLKKATDELARQRYLWNTHVHWLAHGFYPPRGASARANQFKGTDQDRLFELFKIMDGEVRRLAGVLESVGAARKLSAEEEAAVHDEISARTGLTASSHRRS
jgi:hypothetical protein